MPSIPPTTVSSPADLAAVAPHVIGYHPSDAIVLVVLRGQRLRLAGCLDLPADTADPRWRTETAEAVGAIPELGGDRVMLAGYGTATATGPVLDAVTGLCEQAGVPVAATIQVTGGLYRLHPQQPGSQALAVPGSEHPGVAALNAAGYTAAASREAVEARLAATDNDAAKAITAAVAALDGKPRQVFQARRLLRRLRRPGALSVASTALLLTNLQDTDVRDQALICIDHQPPATLLPLWEWLTRQAPAGHAATPAAICAYAAWRAGEDLLAHVAIDRAIADRPGHDLAEAVWHLLASGIDPTSFPSAATLLALNDH